jgi:hypothetical protein
MKQKYAISKNSETGGLTIQEYAELSKDMFSLVCEESYDPDQIQTAVDEGRKSLIDTLRTPNLYPISDYIEKIADTVVDLYQQTDAPGDPVELVFDDVELFQRQEEDVETEEEDSVEIEDLLDDEAPADQAPAEQPPAEEPLDDASDESLEDK